MKDKTINQFVNYVNQFFEIMRKRFKGKLEFGVRTYYLKKKYGGGGDMIIRFG